MSGPGLGSARALALALTTLACEAYDPPPRVSAENLDNDLYDPATGPLALTFSEPIEPETLRFSLRLLRANLEQDLCVPSPTLPAGCEDEAATIVGPCTADFGRAERVGDTADLRIPCGDGGSFVLSGDRSRIAVESDTRLIPFERYVVDFDAGLADPSGAKTGIPLRLGFQVKSAIPLAPTTFASGMFFSVFDVLEPISAQFQFYFYFQVDPATGEVKFFGTDIDPVDTSYDPKVDRVPAHWKLDPNPPTGVTLKATGQIADTPDGRLLLVYPFLLAVTIPKVEARGVEVNARFELREMEGAPPGERDIASGSMFAPVVILGATGEPANLGSGRGRVLFFRLHPDEAPPIEALLPSGLTLEEAFR